MIHAVMLIVPTNAKTMKTERAAMRAIAFARGLEAGSQKYDVGEELAGLRAGWSSGFGIDGVVRVVVGRSSGLDEFIVVAVEFDCMLIASEMG